MTAQGLVNILRSTLLIVPDEPDPIAKNVPGFTSWHIRWLLNQLVEKTGGPYLEVGCHKGATLISAMYRNFGTLGIGVDNFSDTLTKPPDTLRKELRDNIHAYRLLTGEIQYHDTDYFTWSWPSQYPQPLVYFYDGNHREENQRRAVTHFCSWANEPFIMLVDDYDQEHVRRGTATGIQDSPFEIADAPAVDSRLGQWWRGLGAFVLEPQHE